MCQVVDIKTGKQVAKLSGVPADEIADRDLNVAACPTTKAIKRIHGVLLELSVSPSKLNPDVRERVIGKIQEIVSNSLRYEQCDHSVSADMILELVTKIQLMELHAIQTRQYLSHNGIEEPAAIQEILNHAEQALAPFNGGAA